MSDNGLLTIQEASIFSGLAISTLYKAVQKGILPVEYGIVQGKNIKKIRKTDVIKVFNISNSTVLHGTISDITPDITQYNTIEYDRISDIVQENIKKVLEEKQSQLMKPIEEQALYRLGRIEQENTFLRAKVETLLQEIEQYKALPWQIQERDEEIKEIEARHQEEKEELLREYETKLLEAEEERIQAEETMKEKLKDLPAPIESIKQVLMENAHNLNVLQKQKEDLVGKLRQKEQEKEEALKALEAKQQQERMELEARLKAETLQAQKCAEEARQKKEELEAKLKQEEEEKTRIKSQVEKEKAEIEARLKAESEEQRKQAEEEKAKLKAESEEREKQIADAWKKELEMARKPWWKFW